MGNTSTSQFEQDPVDVWWNDMEPPSTSDISAPSRALSEKNIEKLNEFKLELARKHEKRRELIAEKKLEMQQLRDELLNLRKENDELKKSTVLVNDAEIEALRSENIELKSKLERSENLESLSGLNKELKMTIAEMQLELQNLNTEILDFEQERQEYKEHVVALKDVITVSKQMLLIREAQMKELKQKIEEIEETLSGKELNILSQDLRNEYERQLQNIRNLRTLYEERQRIDKREKEKLLFQLDHAKKDLESEQNKHKELQERIDVLETENSDKYDEIKSLESNLGLANAETRQYQAELAAINQLFSEILLGFNNTQDIDLDKLTQLLEEHHDLLKNIVVNESSAQISSALPKVLLDLVNQVNNKQTANGDEGDGQNVNSDDKSTGQMNSAQEIVENLPKVWRVLIELLSHQKAPINELTEDVATDEQNPCYKMVQTPKGPSCVVSVSQTFIRLKNLILEKKSLEKETSHLKQLNTHLENRLQDQEKRLEMVTGELSKTWHVVGKLQKQHQLLHTQEKILRYELAEKRKLLNELKEELEDSRVKWQEAREKNSTTEIQCKQLRTEFAARRLTVNTDDVNSSSIESGYSDERESSSTDEEDEPGYETDVSECNQKPSLSEEIESQPESSEVLDLVQEGIEEIMTNTDDNSETATASTTETDSEKTNLSTNPLDQQADTTTKRSLDEILAGREERLKRLEGQCEQLVTQVTNTAHRSVAIVNKLDDLHEIYGESSSSQQQESPNNDENEEE